MGFFYIQITILQREKNCSKWLKIKLRHRIGSSAEGTVCLVPVPTPAGAEAARAAASSAAAAEIAPCAAEATALVAASAPTVTAAAAAVVLRPSTARVAVGVTGASHFPV